MKEEKSGILAGVLGASCCVIPLFLIMSGLGGSLLTIFLVKYKTYLMTLAVAAIVFAWVGYVRDARECATQFCEITGGRFRKWTLGANTAVVVFFLIVTYTPAGALVGVDFRGNAPAVQAGTQGEPAGVIPPLNPQFGSAAPARKIGDPTRYERLSLRVEGMS